MCGTGACEYLVVGNGRYGAYNTVKPKFTSASLTDQWRPNSRLSIDGGLRLDVMQFEGDDTRQGPARQFWYNAFNLDNCLDAQANLQDKVIDQGAASPTAACAAGATPANITNPAGIVTETYTEFQPRLAFTYSLNPQTVFRASYGPFTPPPLSALTADVEQLRRVARALVRRCGDQGFTVHPHDARTDPELLSRSTDRVHVRPQRREADLRRYRIELDKGNFGRDGVAAKLSLTYTNSYIRYTALPSGSNIIDPLNTNIKDYNAYTSICARNPRNPACGATLGNKSRRDATRRRCSIPSATTTRTIRFQARSEPRRRGMERRSSERSSRSTSTAGSRLRRICNSSRANATGLRLRRSASRPNNARRHLCRAPREIRGTLTAPPAKLRSTLRLAEGWMAVSPIRTPANSIRSARSCNRHRSISEFRCSTISASRCRS